MMVKDLLNTLDNLRAEEFERFKWFLQQSDILEVLPAIKVSELEKAERWETVNLMENTYKLHGALKVTKKVLENIPRMDLVQSLPDISPVPNGQSYFIYLYFQVERVS
ncbi:hypothetical protein L3Q82_012139 [Scortum barcoo]|uniref:Uncharacterized protein n=1 Tax=Scortum barcoo TaxID=214431 RepID=A0ACB8W9S4_9TELE|nr:hypothetical protein L3Q82_012139 [Scortum barcoo]